MKDHINMDAEQESQQDSLVLADIVRPSIGKLQKSNKDAYKIVIEQIREDFFEQHQSPGRIDGLARQLLDTIKELKTEDED